MAVVQPCGYQGTTTKDDGTEATVAINEQADVVNFLAKGKKPPTGIRFYGVKYFPIGGTPRNEGGQFIIQGKGPGAFFFLHTMNKYVLIARCTVANGHSAPAMNDHITTTAKTLMGHGY